MALPIRRPPGVAENQDPRAREYFDGDVERFLKLVGSQTVDLGSIAGGAKVVFTIQVVGARPNQGQTVEVGLPAAFNTDLSVAAAFVSNNDEVTVVIRNPTGGAIDPPLAEYAVRVTP